MYTSEWKYTVHVIYFSYNIIRTPKRKNRPKTATACGDRFLQIFFCVYRKWKICARSRYTMIINSDSYKRLKKFKKKEFERARARVVRRAHAVRVSRVSHCREPRGSRVRASERSTTEGVSCSVPRWRRLTTLLTNSWFDYTSPPAHRPPPVPLSRTATPRTYLQSILLYTS